METLLLLVSQLAVGAQHDLQMPRQIFFAKQFRDPGNALAFFTRYLQQGRVLARNFGDGRIAQKAHHLARKVGGAVALANQVVDLPQHFFAARRERPPASPLRECVPALRRPGCARNQP